MKKRSAYFLTAYLLLVLLAMCTSCSTQRDVLNQKGKIHLLEKATIERTMPGDNVYLAFPGTPKDRPKDTTTTYTSPKGTKVNTTFDSVGNVSAIDIDCPEMKEYEIRETEMTLEYKNKESQRKFNMELAKMFCTTLIWIAAIIAVAWVVRGVLLRRN